VLRKLEKQPSRLSSIFEKLERWGFEQRLILRSVLPLLQPPKTQKALPDNPKNPRHASYMAAAGLFPVKTLKLPYKIRKILKS